ncbi:hypothetical protein [Candidatus Solirubrobacter pratensis]|uniref:hypothetical protein n=1 Tax=Candidatus Solirubrobacter pratensis TaxID=1298857 RepID=UPI0012DDD1E6|nr:hypothetical protein [Candidatus Solirubrobacter pratensis]
MEAATPLRQQRVHVLMGRVLVENLVVDDPAAAAFVRARIDAGEDAARVVNDAIEIGARVLEREHAGIDAEFVRGEFEKVSREVETAFTDKARVVAEFFGTKVDEVFGAENGHLARELQRLFGDESSAAVQHRLQAVMNEQSARMREDLLRQFSSADGSNPLADFKAAHLRAAREAAMRQEQQLDGMREQMIALNLEIQKLQAEKDKAQGVAAELERSAAKGRPYEEAVADAIDAIARGQGDDCDAVGDLRGLGGRKGDVVVDIDGCSGAPRGRIVFEAKNSRKSRKEALAELEEAMATRSADYGVWVVPSEEKLPARAPALREVGGDKLFVVYDPDEGSRLALEVAYSLARARVVMARGDASGLDALALRGEVERALGAMEDVRRIKVQLTNAAGGIEEARRVLDGMAERVRAHLGTIDSLVASASE